MKFEFEMLIGVNLFRFSGEAATPIEFFQQVSPFLEIPRVGPNGEDDLILKHRITGDGKYHYYSVMSPSKQIELKMGVSQQRPGCLFPKGWEPVQYGRQHEDEGEPEGERKPEQPAAARTPEPTPQPASNKVAGYSHDYPNASQRSYQKLCERIKAIEDLGVNEAQWRMRFGVTEKLYDLDEITVEHLIRRADGAITATQNARRQAS